MPCSELYPLETNNTEKGSAYGQGGQFCLKGFQPAAGSVCWPGGFCTRSQACVCTCSHGYVHTRSHSYMLLSVA